ncbi:MULTISPECIES: capsular biosynthesis protein [Pseudomonas]|uniref:capsular biosynthesis protein n=1 Tax=Pseudomonas TaxID=286 RepID=UPI001E5EBF37|nr:capsular biosynthesis protein [Pseudomonas alloputida]
MKRIIMDLDETICSTQDANYVDSTPNIEVIKKLWDYKALGFEVVISTSRNMRTYSGNVGKITANTLPVIIDWLNRHEVPYDEIYVGKPWCGHEGFYVDDKSIRPDEFAKLSYEQIKVLTGIKG